MDLDSIRLLVDFGFVVLIWAVQLVIYPSFQYYSASNLVTWHRLYTKRVTVIVLPLMLTQLLLCLVQVFKTISLYTVTSMLIIILLWLLTFLIFVPLHQKIDRAEGTAITTGKLVKNNWIRTVLWTLLFFISMYHHILV